MRIQSIKNDVTTYDYNCTKASHTPTFQKVVKIRKSFEKQFGTNCGIIHQKILDYARSKITTKVILSYNKKKGIVIKIQDVNPPLWVLKDKHYYIADKLTSQNDVENFVQFVNDCVYRINCAIVESRTIIMSNTRKIEEQKSFGEKISDFIDRLYRRIFADGSGPPSRMNY